MPATAALPQHSHPGPSPCSQHLRRAASNLPWVDCMPAVHLNVYRILQRDFLVLSRAAAEELTARLRRPVKPWDATRLPLSAREALQGAQEA